MKKQNCHTCKRETRIYEKKIRIELAHETLIELGYTANICQKCINQMNQGLMIRARDTKLVLAK